MWVTASIYCIHHESVFVSNLEDFFQVGYTKGGLVDLIIAIADKVVMNYLHNITNVPIDFPLAPEL